MYSLKQWLSSYLLQSQVDQFTLDSQKHIQAMNNDRQQFTVSKILESSAPMSEETDLALHKTTCSYNWIFMYIYNRKQISP